MKKELKSTMQNNSLSGAVQMGIIVLISLVLWLSSGIFTGSVLAAQRTAQLDLEPIAIHDGDDMVITQFSQAIPTFNMVSTSITGKPFAFVARTLPDGAYGTPYRDSNGAVVSVGVPGNPGSYTYELAPGSQLPDGLRLNTDGTVTGTPTKTGPNQSFSVTARPKASVDFNNTVTTLFSININLAVSRAPDQLGVDELTNDRVVLSAVTPPAGSIEASLNVPGEYAIYINGIPQWQTSRVFAGLEPGKTYRFAARFAGIPGKIKESQPSPIINVPTRIKVSVPMVLRENGQPCTTSPTPCAVTLQKKIIWARSNGNFVDLPDGSLLEKNIDIRYNIIPCFRHKTAKISLSAGTEMTSGWQSDGVIDTYDTKTDASAGLPTRVVVMDHQLSYLEIVEAKTIECYANDVSNTSLESLQNAKIEPVILKASYDDTMSETGTAAQLGASWKVSSTPAYNQKGGVYSFTATLGGKQVSQELMVKPVTAAVSKPGNILKMADPAGYPSYEDIGLPAAVNLIYPPEVGAVSDSDRTGRITWTTPVPTDFGKASGVMVFEGTVTPPSFTTLENNKVSLTVTVSNKTVVRPVFTISDKVYDGTVNAVIQGSTTALTGVDSAFPAVSLSGTPSAAFDTSDVGNALRVRISGLTLVGADKNRYQLDLTGYSANITPMPLDASGITFDHQTVTYTGDPYAITAGGTIPKELLGIDYTYQKGSETAVQPITAAGTYEVAARFRISGNYTITPEVKTATLTINQAPINVSDLQFKDTSVTYDGTPKSLPVIGSLPNGVTRITYTYQKDGEAASQTPPIDTGDYTVTASFAVDGNHQKVDDMMARLTIKKLDVNMSGVSFLNKTVVYNGQPEALQLGGAVPSGVTDVFITYQKTGELSPVTTPPTEVGDYTVTANFTVDISHNPVAPMTAVLSITQRDVVMTGISFSNKTVTYNGQPQTLAITGDLPEGMTGVHYSYQKDDGSPASATAPTMAGSYTVTASFDINANYHAVNAKTAVLLINQKEPDMGSISFGDRTVAYDGMQKPVTITGTLPEGVTGVVYTYLKSDAATILTEIPSTVGNYIVTASFMADPNYKVPESKTAHLNITKAAVDMSGIHLDNKTIDYDGQPKHIAITGNQPVGVTGITYTYQKDGLGQASIDPPTEAGTYLVTAVFAVDDNYVVPAPMTAQLVIGKLPVDLTGFTVNGLTVDYDGKPHYLVPSGALPAGMTMVTYSYLKEGELTATENPPIAAGVYAVTINFSVDGNHQSIAPITATLTINKATIDLSGVGFADQSVTYDGSPHGLLLTGTLPSGIKGVTYTYQKDGEATRTTEAPVAAGNYTVTAAFEVEEHYNSVPAKLAVLSIKKAVIDMSGVTFPNISVEQGTNYTPAITGVLPPGVTVSYTYYQDGNPVVQQPTAVGSYTIIAGFTVADSDNYATIASINASLTIVETALKNADMTGVHFNGPEAVVYDGTPKTLTIATPLPAGVQSVSYTYYKDNPDGSVTGLVGAPTDAGEYIVQANFTPETGYNPILSMSTPLVINKADSVLSGVSLDDKTVVYDGTEKILELSGYTPGTIPGIKAVSYLYIKAGESEGVSKAPRDVGTYSVHAIFTVDDNYNNPGIITAQLKIQGRDVDLTGINYGDKTVKYTGTPQKNEITDVLPAGVDQVTYTYLKDGDTTVIEEAPTEVGSYSVRAAFTVESNYNLVPPKTVRLTICAVDIDMAGMTLDSQNFVYDGQEKLISLKGEVPEGIEETVYYYQKNNPDGTAEEATTVRPKNAGDYTVRAVFKTAKGYNPVDPMMAKMHIEKAGINTDLLYFYSQSLTYDGTPKTLAITGQLPEGITGITYRYLPEGASSASDTAPIDVGRYTVKAVFTVDANHNAIADQLAVLTIVKATADLSVIMFDNKTVTYTGSPQELLIGGSLPQGITHTAYTYQNKNGGEQTADKPIDAGQYEVTANFTAAPNYNDIPNKKAELTIVKKNPGSTAGLTFDNQTVGYDGSPKAIMIKDPLPEGIERVSYTYLKEGDSIPTNAEPVNAGVYTVTANFFTNANYNDAQTLTAQLTITKAAVDMSGVQFNGVTTPYNGQPQRMMITGSIPEGITQITYTYQKNGEGSFTETAPKEAGTYAVVATFAVDNNYSSVEPMTAQLIITKKTVEMGGLKITDQITSYDGTEKPMTYSGVLPEGITSVAYTYLKEGEITAVKTAPVHAGSYDVRVFFEVDANYESVAPVPVKLTINKADVILGTGFEDKTVSYNGQPQTIHYTGENPAGVTNITYNYHNLKDGSVSSLAPKEVGEYSVSATFTVDGDHNNVAAQTARLTITKAVFDMSGITFPDVVIKQEETYTVKIQGTLPDFVSVAYAYYKNGVLLDNPPTDIGTYSVVASFSAGAAYEPIPSLSASLVIQPNEENLKDINTEGLTFAGTNTVYDGTAKSISVVGTWPLGVEDIAYIYSDSSGQMLSSAPINAGEYTVHVIFTPDEGYNPAPVKIVPLKIDKASIDLKGAMLKDTVFDYDGTLKTAELTGYDPATPGVEAVTYIYIKEGDNTIRTDGVSEAGSYRVQADFIVDRNHQTIASMSAKLVVNKKNVSIESIDFVDKTVTYNGQPQTNEIMGIKPEGITQITYTYLKDGDTLPSSTAPVNAGAYTVTANFEVNSNHNDAAPLTARLTITKATIDPNEVILEDAVFVYDGLEKQMNYTGELPEGITSVNYTYLKEGQTEVLKTAPIDAGIYNVTVNFTVDSNHHAVISKSSKLTINKADVVLGPGFESKSVSYNQLPQTITYDNIPFGVKNIVYSYQNIGSDAVSNKAPVEEGDYIVMAAFTVDDNHNSVQPRLAELTITPPAVDMSGISFSNITKNEGDHHSISVEGTLPQGVSVTYTYYQDGQLLDYEPTERGSYTVIARFTARGDYEPIPAMTASLIIKDPSLMDTSMSGVTLEDKTVVYDGTPETVAIEGTLPDGIKDVKYIYVISDGEVLEAPPVNAGSYSVHTISELEEGYNPVHAVTATLTIEKAEVDLRGVTLENTELKYDGTPRTVSLRGYTAGAVRGVEDVSYLYIKEGDNSIMKEGPIGLGSYSTYAAFTTDDNHQKPEFMLAKMIIKAGDIDPETILFKDKTVEYNGLPQKLEVSEPIPQGIKNIAYTYTKMGEEPQNKPPEDLGVYSVRAEFTVEEGYNDLAAKTAVLTIKEKEDNGGAGNGGNTGGTGDTGNNNGNGIDPGDQKNTTNGSGVTNPFTGQNFTPSEITILLFAGGIIIIVGINILWMYALKKQERKREREK